MKQLIFLLLFIPVILKAQEPKIANLSATLAKGGVTTLAKDWKYKVGDNPEWANPDFDDSSWQSFSDHNLYNKAIQKKTKNTNIIWYRKRISIDSTITQELVAYLSQTGASEIYLDGELIHSLGKVSSNRDSIIPYNAVNVPLAFPMEKDKALVLAVRFADIKKENLLFQENTGILTIRLQKEVFADLALQNSWRFHAGDNLKWANPDFDDSGWMFYKPSGLTYPIPDSLWQGYGWFRLKFAIDSAIYEKATHMYFIALGAAEIYLDGKLIHKYGVFSNKPRGERNYFPDDGNYFAVDFDQSESHVLAVRFSLHEGQRYKKLLGKYADNFGFSIGLATGVANQEMITILNSFLQYIYILGTMLFLIILLHGFLFILFPAEKSNLYIVIIASLLFLTIITSRIQTFFNPDVLQVFLSSILFNILILAIISMIPFTIHSVFNRSSLLKHKLLIWLIPVFAVVNHILSGPELNITFTTSIALIVVFFSSQVLIQAWKNKQKGVWFVAAAFFGLVLSTVTFFIYSSTSLYFWGFFGKFLVYMAYSSLPLGLTAFMAIRFRDLYANLEKKVKDRTTELNKSLEELRSTQAQLIHSEKMASLGALTAGIAHEIQNPLNFVNNFSEISNELISELKTKKANALMNIEIGQVEIEKDEITEDEILDSVSLNLEKILHHGKRAEAIVKGMLLHSRGSNGHKEPTDINDLCEEYLRLSYHGFRAKNKSLSAGQAGFNAEYKTDFDPNLPKINVVPQDIGRLLLNLINNAFYAVHVETQHVASLQRTIQKPDYKPMVMVSTKHMGTYMEIHVKDNGPGIPEELIDKIFQPFFTTKPTGHGSGLGLSIAYDIVKAHGGHIKVESKESNSPTIHFVTDEEQGTKFIIHLPLN
jgi:two-component system, NtrC family, sensor kinase